MSSDDSIQTTVDDSVQDYFSPLLGGFGIQCNGRVVCGGGNDSRGRRYKNTYTWHSNLFREINQLSFARSFSAAVYVPPNIHTHEGILLVAGGSGEGGTLEYLVMNDSFECQDWRVCKDDLPYMVEGHQIDILKNKLILTGGCISGDEPSIKDVWEGNFSFEEELRVKWSPLPPMIERRCYHVSVVIKEKLFCLGGQDKKSTEYFSFTTNTWQKGPDLEGTLSGAKGVLNPSTGQYFIVGGYCDEGFSNKVYVFDTQKGLIDTTGRVNIPRQYHIAVLL